MRTQNHAQPTERIALPRRLVPLRPTLDEVYDNDPRYAYLQWLAMEARILRHELFGEDNGFTPCGTAAQGFHFPDIGWKNAPQPSTRAELVLRTVGVAMPRAAR